MFNTDKLNRDWSRTGCYASKERGRLEENLVEPMRLGHFVALTGPVGVGKTTLIHNVKGEVEKSKAMVISERQALEKEKVAIALNVHTLFMDFGEQPMSRETILNVIAPDVRDIRTELKHLKYTARDMAYDYSDNATQVNRFLDGKLPADDPAVRHMAVFLKAVGLGR